MVTMLMLEYVVL
jgi:serine/threonine-protein phosphatase 2A regulatory subunit B'